ncbi:MAG: DEAD/DEAH box helicase [Anaerolineales bacterium]|nr:DEAD/DEAH box helicase [Anaerolineales bacterium]
MSFEQFDLSEPLRRALRQQGFEQPTPVQLRAIPPALEGRDVLGVAQTGTGKTMAFLLPSMQQILRDGQAKGPAMLVLAPTRELALQIAEEARRLSQYTRLRIAAVYGGASLPKQAQALRQGVDLVVATPGRLMDHLQRRNVRFDGLRILVLDEADRMLDMGFLPDIDTIVRQLPEARQTLLFSATMPAAIQSLTYRYMRKPLRVEVENARPPEALRQQVYPVPKHLKAALLTALLKEQAVESALVFTRTKQGADIVARKLREAGLSVAEIHGNFHQKERVRALEQFRLGKARILVATNSAARGLDIEGISHVVNYDPPEEAEDYIHRVGRTARVEASGVAWTLVTPDDEPLLYGIEHLLGKKIESARLPGFNYDVPVPDWAKPSAATLRRRILGSQNNMARWRSLTR